MSTRRSFSFPFLFAALVYLSLMYSLTGFSGQAAPILQTLPPSSEQIYLPLVIKQGSTSTTDEWSQHAHDARRIGYTDQVVEPPWRLRWIWNGVDANGGVAKVTTSGRLPRNVQPVTGGGRVYIAAGADGVFALREDNGAQVWKRSGIGSINSTAAYDADTQAVFLVSDNGRLYKLRATDGFVLDNFSTGQTSNLPLPPAVLNDRILFSMGNSVYAVNKHTTQQIWRYNAGETVVVPPAYSPSRDLVIVASEPDLYVHAIRNSDGTRWWHIRPVHPERRIGDPTEYRFGWPVIADNTGCVLIKVRLEWGTLWREWPQNNSAMRAMLQQNPKEQALFVMRLEDGSIPFIANVGHGGYADNDYMPMGPQPVVKRLTDGKEVVYTIIRGKIGNLDSRWDSHFGEMVLDGSTVSGLQGGDVRFIAFDHTPGATLPYLLTDEQPNVSMAGDYLFGGHWEAGFAMRIIDRSNSRGSINNPIPTQRLDTIATSQDDSSGCQHSPSHYCPANLANTRPYDFGFYIYYRQGAVYDRYWSEYAVWVVSNENLYFRSADGAIVALTHGNPQTGSNSLSAAPLSAETVGLKPQPPAIIPHTAAGDYAGTEATVSGRLEYVFNNGRQTLLGFSNPHQGSFKIIIRKDAFGRFTQPPEELYRIGQEVRVHGKIEWYQGDPAIFVSDPDQIIVVRELQE